MTLLRTALTLLLLLALAVPAGAQDDVTDPVEPELYGPCDDTGDATVVTADAPFDGVVETPVGQANLGPEADAGTYVISLEGQEVDTRGRIRITMDATGPSPLIDYDLIINGANAETVGVPETYTFSNVAHCRAYDLSTVVFFGLPVDEVTVGVRLL